MDSSSATPTITTMLIGKTGNGKSSTGNSILMRDEFVNESGGESVTSETKEGATRVGDLKIRVVDTPGLCDTGDHRKVGAMKMLQDHFRAGIKKYPEGVDCFILVFNWAVLRFTKETESVVKILKKMFSNEMFEKYLILIFTNKNLFLKKQEENKAKNRKEQSWEEWCIAESEKSTNNEFKRLMNLCKNRCLCFENSYEYNGNDYTEKSIEEHERQRQELLDVIKKK